MEIYRCVVCNCIITTKGYCDRCTSYKPKPFATAKRYNTSSYRTTRWRALRKEVILRDRACVYCGATIALQVHHLERPKGDEVLFFSISNCVTVCEKCHRLITQKETHRGSIKKE